MSFLTMVNEYFDKVLLDINKQKDKGFSKMLIFQLYFEFFNLF